MLALVITIFSSGSLNGEIVVNAEGYRNGYALIPEQSDASGVLLTSTFLLKVENNASLKATDVQKNLMIEPAIDFSVKKVEEGFRITLAKPMVANNLYKFTYDDAVWVFQTRADFDLIGVLPRDESSGVPINTGIEFYFTHSGAEVEDYFQIEPKVEGKFQAYGKTIAFVPKGGLKYGTIYTVTLKKGLELKDSEQTLDKDYSFKFQTEPKEQNPMKQPLGDFNFRNLLHEFGTGEVPRLDINYYIYNEKKAKGDMKIDVYAYKNIDDFATALEAFSNKPRWSYTSQQEGKIDVKNLTKVQSFDHPLNLEFFNDAIELPEALPVGYYVVDGNWKGVNFQTLIQVTDISFYYIGSGISEPIIFDAKMDEASGNANGEEGSANNLLWVNDLKTGKAIEGATLTRKGTKKSLTTNKDGIIQFEEEKVEEGKSQIYYIRSGNRSAVLVGGSNYNRNQNNNSYWRYIQTDRNLYQPNDTVEFWGFLQNRYKDEEIDELTVEISQSNWYYFSFLPQNLNDLALEKVTVKAENGFYNGKLTLPFLEEGSYQISVRNKDDIVSSSYIEVKKYTKPAYKMELSKDKEAIFIGETINFDINTLFFEGTPVSNLEVNYNLNGMEHKNGTEKSSKQGQVKVPYVPTFVEGTQGIEYMSLHAYAKLPESGEIYGSENVRVFVNDIHVDIDAQREGKKGTLSLQVNKYDLSRLNDGTAKDDFDYLGNAVANQTLKGTIYKNEWKKREAGEYYDYVNKVVRKRYDYYKETTKVKDVSLTTNKEGIAKIDVSFDQLKNCYYNADLTTTDGNGRKMSFNAYFSKNWEYSQPEQDQYNLTLNQEKYDVDDEIIAKYTLNEKPIDEGNFLYITAQNGIQDINVSGSSTYKRSFNQALIPNATIRGVYFNGKTYMEQNASAIFNPESKKLVFEAKTNRESYKPGDVCTINITAKIYSKEEGKYIPAKDVVVNTSIVDEALFKLSEMDVETLTSLYSHVGDGLGRGYGSHANIGNDIFVQLRYFDGVENGSLYMMKSAAPMSMELTADEGAMDNSQVYVRSVFKDTAIFKTMKLDEEGKGKFSFTLPDNVTAWRMTFAGISKSLQAGSAKEELTVSLPFFLNTSLAKTYLVGDQPYVGVSVYGKSLKEGEEIKYLVTATGTDYKAEATGKAFERVNIPLWEMKEGTYDLVIKAQSASGYTDGLEQKITVVKTYHQMEVADYYKLTKGLKIKTNNSGMTTLMMLDQGKGKFLPKLYNLSYSSGKRVDQKYLAYKVSEFLHEQFKVDAPMKDEVKISDYQVMGGIGILPYAEADFETTVKLLPIIKDEVNETVIKLYFMNELQNKESRNKAAALYGLAILGEPILDDLADYEKISNLTLKDHLYLALAYAEIGDSYKAKAIYEQKIEKYVDAYETIKRVKYGKSKSEYIPYTALTMVLASKLNLEDRDLFYKYVTTNYHEDVITNIEEYIYILQEMNKVSHEKAKVTYSYLGEKVERDLSNMGYESIEIPSSKLSSLTFNQVTGDVALVAIYDKAITSQKKQDDHIKIKRTYYDYATGKKTNTFNQSDIVKVVLDVDIDKDAIDHYYTITDYVPSGLAPISFADNYGLRHDKGYYYFRDVDGQKVNMYISRDYDRGESNYYYARVVTPGTYKAEGTIVSGSRIRDSFKIGSQDTLKINID